LRGHFQFVNELILFSDVDHHNRFSINVFSHDVSRKLIFQSISNLYSPATVDACFEHKGYGSVPGIKDDEGKWSTRGHNDRIVAVTESDLDLFAKLYDDEGTPPLQARLPNAHSRQIVEVLRKFAAHPRRLGDISDDYYSLEMWHEANAQKDGTIRRETGFPVSASEWILSGPHFFVGNPFYKTPRAICTANNHYDTLDLEEIPDDYLPRTNYVPACSADEYRRRTPRVPWEVAKGEEVLVTDCYRFCARRQLSQSGERTLISGIFPPGVAHVHPVNSTTFRNGEQLLSFTSFCLSLLYDFFIKTTGKGDLYESTLRLLPFSHKPGSHISQTDHYNKAHDSEALHLRALLLTCLTTHYADLWRECFDPAFTADCWAKDDPRLDNANFQRLIPTWERNVALRTDYARRQALVEIDVLAAMALGLTLDELVTITVSNSLCCARTSRTPGMIAGAALSSPAAKASPAWASPAPSGKRYGT